MKDLHVFLIFLFVRIASVFLIQTFFVPDEYWQSLEVAHNMVFKYGYLTWEWSKGIRSYIPPLAIAALYKILRILGLDNATNLIYGPRVLQALLSSYSDLCLYKWSVAKKWAIFCISLSWFWFYTGSRTLINTLECCLSTIALSKFPWPGTNLQDTSTFIWIVALLFAIRPTGVILWVPLFIYHLMIHKKSLIEAVKNRYIPIWVTVIALSTLLDSLSHGKLIVTPYEFLKFNLVYDIASFYGEQPWYWYILSGLPVISGVQFIPFIIATFIIVYKNRRAHAKELLMLGSMAFTIAIYSFLPHKEFRFILPLLPLVLYISTRFLSVWSRKARRLHVWIAVAFIFINNVIPIWYFGRVHQRGTLDIMTPLRNIALEDSKNTSVLFVMPCHSTPLYSHLHVNVSARFLTCVPNLNGVPGYVDEADMFFNKPSEWFQRNYPDKQSLPSHIVTFNTLFKYFNRTIYRYAIIYRTYHTSILTSSRVGGQVVLFAKKELVKTRTTTEHTDDLILPRGFDSDDDIIV